MKRSIVLMALTAFVLSCAAWAEDAAAPMWIRAAKVELKDGPTMSAKKVVDLKRGDQVKILEKQALWYRVNASGKQGWVSKLLLSETKPVGNADLSKDVTASLEKTSRRRSSSFAVSAATRGLNAEGRAREGRTKYQADAAALKEVEDYKVNEKAAEKFGDALRK